MSVIRCIDFETTDEPPDAAVCEAGYCDLINLGEAGWQIPTWTPAGAAAPVEHWVSHLVDPERFISPKASAVHHLVDEDVKGMPTWAAVEPSLRVGDPVLFSSHQVKFERAFFDPPGARWICTWKVALRMATQAPSWSLQALRYWLGLKVDRALASPAHRAGPDSYVGAHLLRRMLAKGQFSVDQMVAISAEPAMLPRITFGKHKDSAWDEVPIDYLFWITDKSDMDEDVKFTARHWIKERHARR